MDIHSVEWLWGSLRVEGECVPPWLGPPEGAAITLQDSAVQVGLVEVGLAGLFALEADGDPRDGDTIQIRLGEAWAIVQVFET